MPKSGRGLSSQINSKPELRVSENQISDGSKSALASKENNLQQRRKRVASQGVGHPQDSRVIPEDGESGQPAIRIRNSKMHAPNMNASRSRKQLPGQTSEEVKSPTREDQSPAKM